MKRGLTGHYPPISTLGEVCRAFVPAPLPPEPGLFMDDRLQALAQQASLALGRLDGISSLLPEPQHLLYSYIWKEAVLSSQIEGTQSSIWEEWIEFFLEGQAKRIWVMDRGRAIEEKAGRRDWAALAQGHAPKIVRNVVPQNGG